MQKDSFIIYKSFYEPIRGLSDKQLGRLFRALFDYQIEGSTQVDADLQMAFAFFKNQMDIDEGKYQKVVERNKLNGSKGGRPTKEENPKNPVGYKKPKKADNDNEYDNDPSNEGKRKLEKEISEIERIMLEDENQIQTFWRNNNADYPFLTIDLIRRAISGYFRKLEDEGIVYNTLKEARKHFSNWYKLKLKSENQNETNRRNSTESGNDRKRYIAEKFAGAVAELDSGSG